MVTSNDVQQRADDFLTIPTRPIPTGVFLKPVSFKRFSPFDSDQLKKAIELAGNFMKIANSIAGDAGLQAVLDEAVQATDTEDPELVRHALMVFITHHPRGSTLRIRPIEQRAPLMILPSSPPIETFLAPAAPGQPTESLLNWFREDPKVNEHHEHWHVVYPGFGVPDPSNPGMRHTKDRQGELFIYMHQQMIARYDTERLAVGLAPVTPLDDYAEMIQENYDPSPHLETRTSGSSMLFPFSARPSGEQMGDLGQPGTQGFEGVSDLKQWGDNLLQAAISGRFQDGTTVTPHLLGSAIEASIDSDDSNTYGDHHNSGHIFLAYINDPADAGSENDVPGVMSQTRTAVRDPIFYRWHKHIDNISSRWQEQQPPNNFADAPPVLIRKGLNGAAAANANQSPDIILCFKDAIQSGSDDTDAAWQSFGETNFGGANWNIDFSSSSSPATTNQLQTMMRNRRFTFLEDDRATVTIQYLYPREFFYFLRVENQDTQARDVTARIFLVAQSVAGDRSKWIEMDKFRHSLNASEKTVIFRRADVSSVIRKPAVKTLAPIEIPVANPRTGGPDSGAPENYCDCGWPYNLLLPRGTRDGMGFRLLVMLTDWTIDQVPDDSTCGSMSYCGAKDRYPDSRAMGYPFDRPSPSNSSIAQVIATQQNMAARDITIKWVDAPSQPA